MKNPLIYIVVALLLTSCSNVTTGFEMIGEFEDGKYTNDFSIDSRYWPSFMMVIPEHTDLENKEFEAVAIFNDYGVMNEQNPVGYNISHFTQNGINAKRKTIFSIEDKPNLFLYLDDANTESVAYSTYDDDLGAYEYFIQGIDGGDTKKVANGDGDKLNSYSSVVGKEIFWTEVEGDDVSIIRDHLDGEREVMVDYTNAYAFLLESNGAYIAYYVEIFDEDFNLESNEVIVYDVNANKEIQSFDVDDNLEITSGSYDGTNVFLTAYDYGNEEYLYARMRPNGKLDVYDTSDDNDFTFTGSGSRVMALETQSSPRDDYYEAEVSNITSGDSDTYSDLLNAGFYNGYLFMVECDLNSNYLIDNLSLRIEKAE